MMILGLAVTGLTGLCLSKEQTNEKNKVTKSLKVQSTINEIHILAKKKLRGKLLATLLSLACDLSYNRIVLFYLGEYIKN